MLIILEGPDLVGKSTLAGQLVTQLASRYRHSVELLHRSPPTSHPLDEYVTPLLSFDPRKAESVVCDRWHLGELVYPGIKKRPTKMHAGVSRYVQLFLQSRGAMVAILNLPCDDLRKRLAERGDDSVTEEELMRVSAAFRVLSERPDVTYERYLSFTPTVDTLINSGEGCRRRVTSTPFITYVGSRAPEILIVGDERSCRGGDVCMHTWQNRSHGPAHSTLGPAFMPYPATSGDFLMRALEGARLTQPTYGLANACDVDDITILWRELHRPAVVTLGVKAADRLDELGIPHGSVPHPQYVRRFHHRHAVAYGTKIFDVARSGEDALSWRP